MQKEHKRPPGVGAAQSKPTRLTLHLALECFLLRNTLNQCVPFLYVTHSPSSISPDILPATAFSFFDAWLCWCKSMFRARSKTTWIGAFIFVLISIHGILRPNVYPQWLVHWRGLLALFVVGPHPQYKFGFLFFKHFIDQTMLDVDSARAAAIEISGQLFIRGRILKRVLF